MMPSVITKPVALGQYKCEKWDELAHKECKNRREFLMTEILDLDGE